MLKGFPDSPLRVLMVTSEWPTPTYPISGSFIIRSVEFLRRAGVQVEVFHFRGAKNPVNYLRAWLQLQRQLRHKHYDLLHAQFGQSGLLSLPKTLPLVVTFHGSDLEGILGSDGRYTMAGRILQLVSRGVAYMANEVIIVSESLARHLPERSFHVIPTGVDLDLFCPMSVQEARHALGLPLDKCLVLFAANPHNPVKRYWLAQAAVDRLCAELDIELLVTSDVAPASMPLYFNACNALLLTSLHEGSPNVVKEALACNLAVVSTDVGDVRMRLRNVEGCAIVPDSPDAIASALRLVINQPSRIDGRRAIAALAEQVLTQQVLEVYCKALANQSSALASKGSS